jgi:WD40 repeat protein
VYSVALSPQGETFASGDRTLRLWNAKTGQCLKSLRELSPRIVSIAYSPDGHLIATSCYDTSVKLWDATTGKCLKTLQGHTAWSWGVAISPDGKTLASSGGDYTVKLWNIKTGTVSQDLYRTPRVGCLELRLVLLIISWLLPVLIVP